ncbi:TPA: hypothetical protein ACQVHG_004688, partial [Serratia marcescens]
MQTRSDMLFALYAFIGSHRLLHYSFYYSSWNKSHWVLCQCLVHSGLLLSTNATGISETTEARQSPINFIYYYIDFVTMSAKSSLAAALQ